MTNIIYARRTPMGKFMGGLSAISAPRLGAVLVRDAVRALGLDGTEVDEILMGQVLQAGAGQAPARQAALLGGLPNSVCATTINRVCASGLKSVMIAEQTIATGNGRLIFAGGQESMSLAPFMLPEMRRGVKYGAGQVLDHLHHDGLRDCYDDLPMGKFGEVCAQKFNFSREEQDDYALESYRRAIESWNSGHYEKETVAVEVKGGEVLRDEEPFAAKLDKLRSLRPAFAKEGTITAGNASTINDGAALLVLSASDVQGGAKPIARIVAHASLAQAPSEFTTAPIGAITKVCERAGLKLADIELFEINEAFAVVPMAVMRELKIPHEKVNICGGAVAMGHPLGASGARVLVTLLNALEARQGRYGLATLCIGGGEASALIVERCH